MRHYKVGSDSEALQSRQRQWGTAKSAATVRHCKVGSARSDSTRFVKVNRLKTNCPKTRPFCIRTHFQKYRIFMTQKKNPPGHLASRTQLCGISRIQSPLKSTKPRFYQQNLDEQDPCTSPVLDNPVQVRVKTVLQEVQAAIHGSSTSAICFIRLRDSTQKGINISALDGTTSGSRLV